MANNRITIFQGNSDTVFVSILDSSSNQMNLTNYAGKLSVKKERRDTSFTFQKDHATKNNSEGTVTFNVSPSDSSIAAGDYYYDVTITDSSNNLVYTVVQDRMVIVDSVRY